MHAGSSSSDDWRAYVHVIKADHACYEIQYWFFYAYNDSLGPVNHESDWEHIAVIVSHQGIFQVARYAQHETSTTYTSGQLTFVGGTHPVVYSADGSHASYPNKGEFWMPGLPVKDYTYDGGPIWDTWKNLVNVGEKGHHRNGQNFINYGGLWEEIGSTDTTSGKRGPAFLDAW